MKINLNWFAISLIALASIYFDALLNNYLLDNVVTILTILPITRNFKVQGGISSSKIYHSLYSFLKRFKSGKYIKLIVKITVIDHLKRNRVLSLTRFMHLNLHSSYDIKSFLNHLMFKYNTYMDKYNPTEVTGFYIEYFIVDSATYLDNTLANPWVVTPKEDNPALQFPLTVNYNELAETAKESGFYTDYSDCKGFKDAKFSSFRVTPMLDNEITQIFSVQLSVNKIVYQFNDILDKTSGVVTRKFLDGTVVSNDKFVIKEIENKNKITFIKGSVSPVINVFTLDIETYSVIGPDGLIQKLLSIAVFNGSRSFFYYLPDYENETQLVEAALTPLFSLKKPITMYIHNGGNFDLVFLMNHFVTLKEKLGIEFNVIYKDGAILSLEMETKTSKIIVRDSYKMLNSSLAKLAKIFEVSEVKGAFPFDFVNADNFNYVGDIPEYKYFAFNGKPIITLEEYNILKEKATVWNLREELMKYNVNDCIVLFEIITNFSSFIMEKFNVCIHYFPTLSSLAFGIFRCLENSFIPKELLLEKTTDIDCLSRGIDKFIRESYFGGHVDAYIPHFDFSSAQWEGLILYHYDVVSLYPFVMKTFDIPFKVKSHFTGDLLKFNPELFENSLGFYKVKVKTPKTMDNPLLPYRDPQTGQALYPLGSWIGTYFSEEIKNCIKFGYKFEILEGYIFQGSSDLFSSYILL
jgi:hypothetical protein